MKTWDIAVVGATTLVGEAILELLTARDFPLGRLHLLEAGEQIGETATFAGRELATRSLLDFDFSTVQLALFAGPCPVEQIQRAAAAGCVVIDHRSPFHHEPEVPLVVADVNPAAIVDCQRRGIVAGPGAGAVLLTTVLKPLLDGVGLERVEVVICQAVSGAGRAGMEELIGQSAKLLNAHPATPRVFERQIAFNILPRVGRLQAGGHTEEELRLPWEVQKILAATDMEINVTALQVPVFHGHGLVVHLRTRQPLTALAARDLLESAPGIVVLDEPRVDGYPTAVIEAANGDSVFVGRLREDISRPQGLNLWVVGDNVRRGAALNGVKIAEILIRDHL